MTPTTKIDLKKNPLKPCSEEFLEAISDGAGSIRGECEFCGTTYFDGSQGYAFNEGEIEGLRKAATEQPEKFEEWDCGISFCTVDNTTYVYGCPCNGPRLYEDWVWGHRWKIAKYLKSQATNILTRAKDFAEATEDIPRLIDLAIRHTARKVEDAGSNGV